MKTENTPENKAKFFAQHWGQTVMQVLPEKNVMGNSTLFTVNAKSASYRDFTTAYSIVLKPLSKITEEDAIKVAEIIKARGDSFRPNNIKTTIQSIFLERKHLYSVLDHYYFLCAIDFLRSKSYLLPYMDLSIDDLISYGWVKIKTL